LKQANLAPGALVSVLQKGLQYLQVEAHLQDDGTERECSGRFSLVHPHVCVDPSKPRTEEEDRKRKVKREERKRKRKEQEDAQAAAILAAHNVTHIKEEMEDVIIQPREAQIGLVQDAEWLQGHTSEVFASAWNPHNSHWLATSSGDGTVRVWNLENASSRWILPHGQGEVSALEWSPDGVLLATAAADGNVRVWQPPLEPGTEAHLSPIATLGNHSRSVFAVKWSKNGRMLLTGGEDQSVSVWQRPTHGEWTRLAHIVKHQSACMDVDWRDDQVFATCSSDRTIQVYQLDSEFLQEFVGHEAEVNCIRWSPSGHHLASASDDMTARVWKVGQGEVGVLRGHDKSVYSLKWCSPQGDKILATYVFLWW
jgi:transducin (beta)-like 1